MDREGDFGPQRASGRRGRPDGCHDRTASSLRSVRHQAFLKTCSAPEIKTGSLGPTYSSDLENDEGKGQVCKRAGRPSHLGDVAWLCYRVLRPGEVRRRPGEVPALSSDCDSSCSCSQPFKEHTALPTEASARQPGPWERALSFLCSCPPEI